MASADVGTGKKSDSPVWFEAAVLKDGARLAAVSVFPQSDLTSIGSVLQIGNVRYEVISTFRLQSWEFPFLMFERPGDA